MVTRNHVKEIKYIKKIPFHKLLIMGTLPYYSKLRVKPTFLAKIIKKKLRGYCATDNIKTETLIRTIFLALK